MVKIERQKRKKERQGGENEPACETQNHDLDFFLLLFDEKLDGRRVELSTEA
jgi:hypothetical protein